MQILIDKFQRFGQKTFIRNLEKWGGDCVSEQERKQSGAVVHGEKCEMHEIKKHGAGSQRHNQHKIWYMNKN